MEEVTSAAALRARVAEARQAHHSVGLVPTMGALHLGHLRLIEAAQEENDLTVVSIYVNPTQFGPTEDFARYPRDLARDRELLRSRGVDILFRPDDRSMYPDGPDNQRIWVDPGVMAEHMCGASRPGHFRGVATVVTKLLNLTQPDRAYFGQKDAQQSVILSRMVSDLNVPVEIIVVPTVREQDGLALSSRNMFLSPPERAQAPVLFQALSGAERAVQDGQRASHEIEARIRHYIAENAPLARIEYVSVVDAKTLQPIAGLDRDSLIALAVHFGPTRLIDNVFVARPD